MESIPVPEPAKDVIETVVESADKKVDEAAETVGTKIDEAVKPLDKIVEKSPEVVEVAQEVMHGRSCSIPCWLWICTLQITRRTRPTAHAKSADSESKESK